MHSTRPRLIVRFAALLAGLCHVAAADSAAMELVMTKAGLLPGGLNGCATPGAATCVGGSTAVGVVLRRLRAEGVPVVFVPELERASLFPKLHPAGWGVNSDIWRRHGAAAFVSGPPFVTPSARVALLPPAGMVEVLDSVNFAPGNALRRVVTPVAVDRATGIALVPLRASYHSDLAAAAALAVELLSALPAAGLDVPVVPVVLSFDTPPADVMAALRAADPAVAAGVRAVVRWQGSPAPAPAPALDNGTWLASLSVTADAVHRVQLTRAGALANAPLAGVAVVAESISGAPPVGDVAFDADRAVLAAEAAKAVSNNPVLGAVAGPVAAATVPGKPRLCTAAECPAGNMWADAIRHVTGAEVGLMNGHFIEGPAIPAGDIKLQQSYASFHYLNKLCRATVLGLTLVEIVNASVARSDFDATNAIFRPSAALLQVSGVRVAYDRTRPPASRLIAVDVLGAGGEYEPVRRLSTYTVGTLEYACSAWHPYSDFLAARYAGEEKGKMLPASDLHRGLGAFLRSQAGAYTPGVFGRLVDRAGSPSAASAGNMAGWIHTPDNCNGEFDDSTATCTPRTKPAEPKTLVIALASGLAALFVVGAAAAALIWWRLSRRRLRDTTKAPKDEGQPFAIVFTDIESSTALWARFPKEMPGAVAQHHRLVRAELARCGGYEVKTIGDAFMAAFVSAADAVRFALAVQEALYAAEWKGAVDSAYRSLTENSTPEAEYAARWHGLRVRVGVHFGEGSIVLDEVTSGYDYYGTVVNTAARVEAVSHGGQVCVSGAVAEAARGEFLAEAERTGAVSVMSLGPQVLRGLDELVVVVQLLPAALENRVFPPLRLEKAEAVDAVLCLSATASVAQRSSISASRSTRPSVPMRRLTYVSEAGSKSSVEVEELRV